MRYKYIIFYDFIDNDNNGKCEIVNEKKIKSIADITKIENVYYANKNEKINIRDYKYVGFLWK
jgi:hypothetical protein